MGSNRFHRYHFRNKRKIFYFFSKEDNVCYFIRNCYREKRKHLSQGIFWNQYTCIATTVSATCECLSRSLIHMKRVYVTLDSASKDSGFCQVKIFLGFLLTAPKQNPQIYFYQKYFFCERIRFYSNLNKCVVIFIC